MNQAIASLKKTIKDSLISGESYVIQKKPQNNIFICSYPRSGNTVMRLAMAQGLLNRSVDVSEIDKVTVEPYASKKSDINNLVKEKNCIIKWHSLPSSIHQSNKIIYLYRDPIKVCRSYYTYKKYRHQTFSSRANEFIDEFINGTLDSFGRWDINVQLWKTFINNNGGCFLDFDNMINDPGLIYDSIQNFYQIDDFDKKYFTESFLMERKSSKKGKNAEFFKSTKGHDEFEEALLSKKDKFLNFQQIYYHLTSS